MRRDACDILKILFKVEVWRRQNKWSMEDISLELDLSNEVYREWVSGRALPNTKSLQKIKEFLKEREKGEEK